MTQPAVNSEQVAALFAERQRYEAWLSALEAKRATTPPHIYHRVHADYAARLQRVVEQLTAHRAVLQQLESSLVERLAALDIDEAKHRDEAAEAELRATVGELTPEQHREVQRRADAAVTALAQDRARVTEELARLRGILESGGIGSTPQRPTAAPPTPPASPAAPTAPAAGGAGETPRMPGILQGAESLMQPQSDWDLSFERTPAPPTTPPAAASSAPQRADGAPGADPSHVPGPFDDLEFLKTVTDAGATSGENVAVGSGVTSGAGHERAGAPAGSQGAPGDESAAGALAQPAAPRAGAEAPAPREPSPAEVKTLKCSECGTLNYPTEWYCERCGAELAAL